MLLQTLAENAIKHGIAQLPGGGLLRVAATVQNEVLMLEVENPRPPAPTRMSAHEGVGLHNARDRLRLLFGERASLELDLKPAVATARLRIPLHK
jgi:sensor histidine kinase YesM